MTDPTDATLQHADVNSGNAVELNLESFKLGWKNLVKTVPVGGKYDITESEFYGFENPVIVISGNIDTDDTSSNLITQALLMDFAQASNHTDKTKLTITCTGEDATAVYLKGRPTAGYSIGGTYTNYIYVQIMNVNIESSVPESQEGRLMRYTIEMVETT